MSDIKHFIVLGLGTFGSALTRQLHANGCRVTAIDAKDSRVDALKDYLYEAIIGDVTDYDTLAHLPLANADAAIVCLTENIAPSLLATLHMKELGAKRIIARGVDENHGKILHQLGVERTIFPETEIAVELADKLSRPNIIDYLSIDPEYSFVEIAIPESLHGVSLLDSNLRRDFSIWVVGVKDAMTSKLTMFPDPKFVFAPDQMMLVVGKKKNLDRFSQKK
jgi:trk system potassium uptake protein TrkA